MIQKHIVQHVNQILSNHFNYDFEIIATNTVGGGSINDAYCLTTNKRSFFLKTNSALRFPKMFEKEAKGLNLLKNANAITIPKVITFGEVEETSYLLLEWIESANLETDYWQNFGVQLAKLHQNTSGSFGLDEDNYIGSLYQSNRQHPNWVDFFIQERLQAQIKMAVDASKIDNQTVSQFENLYKELPNIFPQEPPALLHGDLWSGNYMVGNNGEPVIIDPAVYYGHREMDIAMTKLFGGFGTEMYRAYHEQYPLQQGWKSRIKICNLYPLLVHVNLFGGGYLQQVKSIVSKFN